jgi:hypothetical protein
MLTALEQKIIRTNDDEARKRNTKEKPMVSTKGK